MSEERFPWAILLHSQSEIFFPVSDATPTATHVTAATPTVIAQAAKFSIVGKIRIFRRFVSPTSRQNGQRFARRHPAVRA